MKVGSLILSYNFPLSAHNLPLYDLIYSKLIQNLCQISSNINSFSAIPSFQSSRFSLYHTLFHFTLPPPTSLPSLLCHVPSGGPVQSLQFDPPVAPFFSFHVSEFLCFSSLLPVLSILLVSPLSSRLAAFSSVLLSSSRSIYFLCDVRPFSLHTAPRRCSRATYSEVCFAIANRIQYLLSTLTKGNNSN